jgi:hypothetical protein
MGYEHRDLKRPRASAQGENKMNATLHSIEMAIAKLALDSKSEFIIYSAATRGARKDECQLTIYAGKRRDGQVHRLDHAVIFGVGEVVTDDGDLGQLRGYHRIASVADQMKTERWVGRGIVHPVDRFRRREW